jgi:putative ABC transport system permease protein
MVRTVDLIREATDASRASPAFSLLTLLAVTGMCVAVLLTTGRAVATEQTVLARIDAAGTRTIIIRSTDPSDPIRAGVVSRLLAFDSVQNALALGPLVDVHVAAPHGGPRVGAREVTSGGPGLERLTEVPAASSPVGARVAVAAHAATDALGLADGIGTVADANGRTYVLQGQAELPDHVEFLASTVLIPSSEVGGSEVGGGYSLVVVLARSPGDVDSLSRSSLSVLGVRDVTTLTVETSSDLASIRSAVGGELRAAGERTVSTILTVSALVLSVTQFGLVTLRRRDFGRRRALGATRVVIFLLIVYQAAILAVLGATLGVGLATLVLILFDGGLLPGWRFIFSVAYLAVLLAVVSAALPAVLASQRDPVRELRVP